MYMTPSFGKQVLDNIVLPSLPEQLEFQEDKTIMHKLDPWRDFLFWTWLASIKPWPQFHQHLQDKRELKPTATSSLNSRTQSLQPVSEI